jgi:hypothetical protein
VLANSILEALWQEPEQQLNPRERISASLSTIEAGVSTIRHHLTRSFQSGWRDEGVWTGPVVALNVMVELDGYKHKR